MWPCQRESCPSVLSIWSKSVPCVLSFIDQNASVSSGLSLCSETNYLEFNLLINPKHSSIQFPSQWLQVYSAKMPGQKCFSISAPEMRQIFRECQSLKDGQNKVQHATCLRPQATPLSQIWNKIAGHLVWHIEIRGTGVFSSQAFWS